VLTQNPLRKHRNGDQIQTAESKSHAVRLGVEEGLKREHGNARRNPQKAADPRQYGFFKKTCPSP